MTDWAYERVVSSIMTSRLPVGPPKAALELDLDFPFSRAEQDARNEADADNGLELMGCANIELCCSRILPTLDSDPNLLTRLQPGP